ncbi:MAG: DUF885 family protein [bacterium]|nr:DUF885 family protein [Gammaproteobacteria bacterium]HIL95952.1 DUF885 family protein [Pseudomonadales bacterium]
MIQGIWKSRGYGWLLLVQQDHYALYDITDVSCVEFERGNNSQFELGFSLISIEQDYVVLTVNGDITQYEFDRIDSMPSNVQYIERGRFSDPEFNFEVLWQTFQQDYAFFGRHQVDWSQTYKNCRAEVNQNTTDEQLFHLFKTMLAPLQDNHVHLIGMGEEFVSDKNLTLKTAFMDAFQLDSASLGEAKTIQSYQVFLQEEILHHQGKTAGNGLFNWGFVAPGVAYLNVMRLYGLADTPEAKNASGLPATRHEFATFLQNDLEAAEQILDTVMHDFADADALILDIRVNGGGFDKIGIAIANRFTDRRSLAFTKRARQGEAFGPTQQLYLEPQGNKQFSKPVYMLAAERTASAGEILAMCMIALPNVTYVGQPTMGIFSDDLAKHLPNGWKTTLSNEIYALPDGTVYESYGLQPAIPAPVMVIDDLRNSLLQGVQLAIDFGTRETARKKTGNPFEQFMQRAFIELMMEVPEYPTHMGVFEVDGIHCPQDRFSKVDDTADRRRVELLVRLTTELKSLDRATLDPGQKISAEVFEFFLSYAQERNWVGTKGERFLSHKYVFCPSVGLQSELPLFLRELHPFRHARDARDYVSRVNQIPGLVRDGMVVFNDQFDQGITPPDFILEDLLEEIRSFIQPDNDENVIVTNFEARTADLADLSPEGRELLSARLNQLLPEIYESYRELLLTLEQALPKANDDAGVWKLPDGQDYYEFLLRGATTTALSAEEIHQLGLEETSVIQNNINQGFAQLGYPAMPIKESFERLIRESQIRLEDTPATRTHLIEEAKTLLQDVKERLPQWFRKLPAADVVVEAIPKFTELSRNQTYNPPSLDGSRHGKFELNLHHLLVADTPNLPVLVYHETWPGHHLQLSLALENESLPLFNRTITFDAYIEGWAKYAETLPLDQGQGTSPEHRLLGLRAELISTVNLVLDTGIHQKKWTRQQAIDWFVEQTGMPEEFARYVVHRSCAVPAQLCSYKLGLMKVRELKEILKEKRGGQFNLPEFHDLLLRHGSLPLLILEREFLHAVSEASPYATSD